MLYNSIYITFSKNKTAMREDRSLSGVKMAGREGQKYSMREFSGVTELF